MVFEIPLAEQKVKPHQVTALHLITGFALLAGSAVVLLANNTIMTLPGSQPIEIQKTQIDFFDAIDLGATVVMIAGFIILIAALFRNKWLRSPRINQLFRIAELIISAAIAIYLLVKDYPTPAAIFGILAAALVFSISWENSTGSKPPSVIFSDTTIKLPVTSRRRSVSWADVEKVLLRHGNITINCVNNRMFQWVTAKHDVDTELFEAYCDAQIENHKKERTADW